MLSLQPSRQYFWCSCPVIGLTIHAFNHDGRFSFLVNKTSVCNDKDTIIYFQLNKNISGEVSLDDKVKSVKMDHAIICSQLTKTYGSQFAVDHIDLKIKHGSIFGLLGPNGAGKTTIIKMLTGLATPSSGNAIVAGYNVAKDSSKVKEIIGWVSSEVILDDSLTSFENIWIQSKLHNLGKKWKEKAFTLMKYFELDEREEKKKVGQFSTGTRKKLEITMALLHEPKILFMDEPTIGLDANTRRLLWNLIKKINKLFGVTILLTTLYIEEADVLCDNLAIISQGKNNS